MSRFTLNKHKKTCGLKRTYPCRECKKLFTDKRAHGSHEFKCVTPKCNKCGQVFANTRVLGRHLCPKFELNLPNQAGN